MPWTEAHRELREEFDKKTEENKRGLAAERVAKMLDERGGRLNDNFSVGPGVTVYLTDFDVNKHGTQPEQMARIAEKYDRPVLTEALDPAEGMVEGCYKLELPEGGFFLGVGGFDFYEQIDDGAERNDTHLFATGYAFIVRIEGHHGELWQNHDYSPDGAPLRGVA